MTTTASAANRTKFRSLKLAAVSAVAAGLTLAITAPFASAGPLVFNLGDKVTEVGKSSSAAAILAFTLTISGPKGDMTTVNPNEAHLLSEFFSISGPAISRAAIRGTGGVKIFPGDTSDVYLDMTTTPTLTAADVLAHSFRASSPGSLTLFVGSLDGQAPVKTINLNFPVPVVPGPTTTSTTTTTTKAVTPTNPTPPLPPPPQPVQPPVVVLPPVVATVAPVIVPPVAPVVSATPAAVVAPAVVAGPVSANKAPTAAPMSLLAAAGINPFALQGADPEGSPISFALAKLPTHGKLTGQAPNLAYTPDAKFVGLDAFTFTANDGKDTSAEATVMVTVTGSTKVSKGVVKGKKLRISCRGKGARRVCR